MQGSTECGLTNFSWVTLNGPGSTYVKSREVFFRHTWDFVIPGKRSGETLPKGNYEWPFEHIMPGNSPESVEGLEDSCVIYRMKAKIERGILQQNPVARKHIRLIRTLDLSAPELAQCMVRPSIPKHVAHSFDETIVSCWYMA